jgi:hypothetical protein
MSANEIQKPFTFRFIESESAVHLELTNITDQPLKCVEILSVFLKDNETPGGGPSQVHIRFDGLQSIFPGTKALLSHRTWINGKPAETDRDQLARLQIVAGEASPYVLDISWENPEGKMRFQRIPVGH